MAKKYKPGDRVIVGGNGEGYAVVTGYDRVSGIPTVVFEKVTTKNEAGPGRTDHQVQGYVPEHMMVRRKKS